MHRPRCVRHSCAISRSSTVWSCCLSKPSKTERRLDRRCPPGPIRIVSCVDAPADQPTQRSTILARIIFVVDYRIVMMIHGGAGTSSRSYFTPLPVRTTELKLRIVSFFFLLSLLSSKMINLKSSIKLLSLSLVVFLHGLSSQILHSSAPIFSTFYSFWSS